jgi:hypothetical protein
MLCQLGFQSLPVTNQCYRNTKFPASSHGTFNFNDGGVVTAHCVNSNSHL